MDLVGVFEGDLECRDTTIFEEPKSCSTVDSSERPKVRELSEIALQPIQRRNQLSATKNEVNRPSRILSKNPSETRMRTNPNSLGFSCLFIVLLHILQIVAEVRVNVVGPSTQRIHLSVTSFFVSFGADQCASSEGFLVTFTLGGEPLEECFTSSSVVVLFHERIVKQDVAEVLQRSFGDAGNRTEHQSGLPKWFVDTGEKRWLVPPLFYPVRTQPTYASTGDEGRCSPRTHKISDTPLVTARPFCERDATRERGEHILSRMVPSLEILVALNPTDEGRIGTGRNLQRKENRSEFPQESWDPPNVLLPIDSLGTRS